MYQNLMLGNDEKDVSLSFLNTLIQRHLHTFCFSSVNVQLQKPLSLEIEAIEERFLAHEGGYCFEHNKLFYHLLKTLGFQVRSSFAKVMMNSSTDNVAKTHRFSIVNLDGSDYIVDVGFGPYSPASAVLMDVAPTLTPSGLSYSVEQENGLYYLYIVKTDEPVLLYRFRDVPYSEMDFEVGHFYSHRSEQANFVKNLMISKHINGQIHFLYNSEYKILGHHHEEIGSFERFASLLHDVFGYQLSDEELTALFQKCNQLK